MKERPIIFNGEMVRAVLDRRKTQTRRVIKPQLEPLGKTGWQWNGHTPGDKKKHGACCTNGVGQDYEEIKNYFSTFMQKSCPYGVPGDRLWVRETWCDTRDIDNVGPPDDRPFLKIDPMDSAGDYVLWRADGEVEWCDDDGGDTEQSFWKPSIHMPRWASRILLEVVSVRVERVQDISNRDALEEGIRCPKCGYINIDASKHLDHNLCPSDESEPSAVHAGFKPLWNSINEKRGFGWDINPWVWIVEFKMIEPAQTG